MLQCVRGLSEEKIATLLEHYPTPRSLYEAFIDSERHHLAQLDREPNSARPLKGKAKDKMTSTSPALMLSELGGRGRKKIGPALSKGIYEIFMDLEYEA
jgi:crossover junction endonuclease MUS81